ncbi:peptidylprolyl isomerase [Mesorhizobium sp. J18]|uniref:FKBP-type peptidyl-prolyl cis-trans isomerase n=1 Tax=Mesorhizobium sp. J18 TaxID=935263 RepID=UPI00119AF5A2|nr:peptidylprolyl isomerase [Mesorhizobium sp. J18]TWG92747.1 peptidylprolyl isomerase [Mesorhizobium sp. J18]TWG92911.1 peptidylprolyl isomerase [Mesorhizobium sp. J18]
MTEVKSGDVVRIHYTGKLADGTEFDSSAGREPLEFQVGAGQIISGLERQVEGMTVGERETVTIPADEAYGPRDERQVQIVPREAFPQDLNLAVGSRLQANTQDGRQIALTVTDIRDDQVTVDANHPLAGRDLIFDVEVVEIVAAA